MSWYTFVALWLLGAAAGAWLRTVLTKPRCSHNWNRWEIIGRGEVMRCFRIGGVALGEPIQKGKFVDVQRACSLCGEIEVKTKVYGLDS